MISFFLQTVNSRLIYDFSFELERSIDYQKWLGNNFLIEYVEDDQLPNRVKSIKKEEIKDIIPIGSVEFVLNFCKLLYGDDVVRFIKPLNIPKELFKYSSRSIDNITILDNNRVEIQKYCSNNFKEYVYVKSNDHIKFNLNGLMKVIDVSELPSGNYQVSNKIDNIVSEYRCFIYHDKLVGIQYYSGDFTVFPNIDIINNMISDFNTDYNCSYTLDVGVDNHKETFVIECHDFFSCGLYGFNDYRILPYMFIRSFKKIINYGK